MLAVLFHFREKKREDLNFLSCANYELLLICTFHRTNTDCADMCQEAKGR